MHTRSIALALPLFFCSVAGCSAGDDGGTPASPSEPGASEGVERVLVSRLVVAASDVDAAADHAEALARAHDGIAERVEVSERRAELVLRVPADALAGVEHDLGAIGTIRERARSGEDVTVAHAEARTRIDVRRAEEARLTAMMESRTSTLAEVLEVERELTRVTEGLEVLEADERALAARIAYARVELTIVSAPSDEGIGALPRTALEGLALTGSVLLGIARVLLFVGPSALVVAAVFAIARRARRHLVG